MKALKSVTIAATALFTAVSTQATTVSYSTFTHSDLFGLDDPNWVVTIDDNTSNQFNFDVSFTGGINQSTDIVAFGLSTYLDYGSNILGHVTNQTETFRTCGRWCDAAWIDIDPDYSFRVQGNNVNQFAFSLDAMNNTLEADTFNLVAIRSTAYGVATLTLGRWTFDSHVIDASQDHSTNGTITNAVPELSVSVAPASLALLAGLMLMGVERRRKIS